MSESRLHDYELKIQARIVVRVFSSAAPHRERERAHRLPWTEWNSNY